MSYSEKFDGVKPGNLKSFMQMRLRESEQLVPEELKNAINIARKILRNFTLHSSLLRHLLKLPEVSDAGEKAFRLKRSDFIFPEAALPLFNSADAWHPRKTGRMQRNNHLYSSRKRWKNKSSDPLHCPADRDNRYFQNRRARQ